MTGSETLSRSLSQAERDALRRALALAADPRDVGTVDDEAWLLALARAQHVLTPSVHADVVARLVERRGLAFACEVLVEGGVRQLETRLATEPWLARRGPARGEPLAAFEALREWLAIASASDFERARRAVRDVRSDEVAEKVAYAFADRARGEACVARALSTSDARPFRGSTLALLSVVSVEAATALVEAACPRFARVGTLADEGFPSVDESYADRRTAGLAAHVFDFALENGEASVPVTRRLLETAFELREPGALLRKLALALSLFASAPAAEALASYLGRKDLDKLTTDYFRAHPELAVAHLAERQTKKSQIGEHARALVAEAERLLEARARTSAPSPGPASSPSEPPSDVTLPVPLARVPWRRKRRVKSDASLDPAIFQNLPETIPLLPRWLVVEALPPLALRSGGALPRESVVHALEMARFSTVSPPYAGNRLVRDALEPGSRLAFARALVATFRAADHRGADFWPLRAAAVIGGPELVLELAESLDALSYDGAEASAERRALAEALLLTESDAAHFEIGVRSSLAAHPIARAELRTFVEARVDPARGVTVGTVTLGALPAHGVDRAGRRELDRAVVAQLDAHLEVHAVDAEGRRLEPTALDQVTTDHARVRAELVALRAAVRRSRDALVRVLEDVVLAERCWLPRPVLARLAVHPIGGPVVRALLWEVDGVRLRIAEDGTFATLDDVEHEVDAAGFVDLVHPADLTLSERRRALELWASYELLWPFPQLERPVLEAAVAERWIASLAGTPAAPDAVERLLARGWTPSTPITRRGRIEALGRVLGPRDAPFVAIVELDPALRAKSPELAEVRVVRPSLSLAPAIVRANPAAISGDDAPLAQLDPTTLTELLVDLGRLAKLELP